MLPELLFSIISLAGATTPMPDPLKVDSCVLPESYSFDHAHCQIRLQNAGSKDVEVQLSAQGTADSVNPRTLIVPAKGTAEATVDVSIGSTAGRVSRGFFVHRNGARDLTFIVNGFAMSALQESRPEVSFGDVEASKLPTEQTLSLSSLDTTTFRIMRVLEKPATTDVAIGEDGRSLTVRLHKDAPLGITDGDIKLAIDTPRQHEAWVHLSANVTGEITVERNPFWFGSVDAGHDRHVLIPLTDRSGRDFKIGHIGVSMIEGHADVAPCEHDAKWCRAIKVTFDDTQRPGLTRAQLDIELPELQRHFILRIWGLLQNDAKRHDANAAMPMPTQEDYSTPWTEGIVESVNAPVYAVPTADPLDPVVGGAAPPAEAPPGTGPLLHWKIVEEAGAYGYQVFRAEARTGPFLLQNRDIIRVHAKDYADTPYFWRDPSAVKGTTYWYYIGVVYKDGHKQVLSAPQSKVAQ